MADAIRPDPAQVDSAEDVVRWYWTRRQLDQVAARLGVPRTGSKQDLTDRLVAHFDGGDYAPSRRSRATGEQLKPPFSSGMVIPSGQRMTRDLRAYLVAHIGPDFRFDGHMRALFADPQGRTLRDAIEVWHRTRSVVLPMGAQFEYNRFTHDYRQRHPQADRSELLAAWQAHKAEPRY